MKRCWLLAFIIFFTTELRAQGTIPPLDKSPMDESYCPNNYPVLKIQDKITEPLMARVIYSRPQKNGRVIFGDLIEYGKVWRLGANEATELELFRDGKIGDTKLKKGRYSLYAIPMEDKWTIIVSRETDTWGSFRYDQKNDVARVEVPVQKLAETADPFSIIFEKKDKGYELAIYWDTVKVSVPFTF